MHFGRGIMGEHSCEIILNLGQWFSSRCCLKKKVKDARQMKDDHNSSS